MGLNFEIPCFHDFHDFRDFRDFTDAHYTPLQFLSIFFDPLNKLSGWSIDGNTHGIYPSRSIWISLFGFNDFRFCVCVVLLPSPLLCYYYYYYYFWLDLFGWIQFVVVGYLIWHWNYVCCLLIFLLVLILVFISNVRIKFWLFSCYSFIWTPQCIDQLHIWSVFK